MTLHGAFIVPHGTMILDPSKDENPPEVMTLHRAMKNVSTIIEELQPEIIFLTSPHSLSLSHDFALIQNEAGSGTAEWKGEYKDFAVSVPFARSLLPDLLGFLKEKNTAVSGITAFSQGEEAPLRWGEVVPLWFLRNLPHAPKYVLLSQPTRRHEKARAMIPEVAKLGKLLGSYFAALDERVVGIVSGDLAHTHAPNGPYGFSEDAEPFDELIEKWARTLNANTLEEAGDLLDQALCCGYLGFIMLQAMLGKEEYSSEVLARATPTYYGMLVAKYLWRGNH